MLPAQTGPSDWIGQVVLLWDCPVCFLGNCRRTGKRRKANGYILRVSLMRDQVAFLKSCGITAAIISPESTATEMKDIELGWFNLSLITTLNRGQKILLVLFTCSKQKKKTTHTNTHEKTKWYKGSLGWKKIKPKFLKIFFCPDENSPKPNPNPRCPPPPPKKKIINNNNLSLTKRETTFYVKS